MLHRHFALVMALAFPLAALAGCVTPDAATPAGPAPADPPTTEDPLAGMVGFVNPDPTGRTGAGPAAIAHRPTGGLELAAGAIVEPRVFLTGATALEPTLGIAPDGSLYTTMIQRRDVGVVFYSPPTVLRSTDAGVSWQPVFQNHPGTQDPYTHVDADTGRIFTIDYLGCNVVSFSDDGDAWTTGGGAGCGWVMDHQTLFTGKPVTSAPIGYENLVYNCAIGGGALASAGSTVSCAKSLDGGITWLPTGEPAFQHAPGILRANTGGAVPGCYAGNGHGFVTSTGRILLPRGHCDQPWLAMSDDEGFSWTRVQVADNGMPAKPTLTEHEAGVVADADGNLYYFWIAADWLPYLAVSRDSGLTWSPPLMVAPPGITAAALPALAIGDGDNLAISYMATTNASEEATWWNGMLAITLDALAPDPLFLTATVNDPADPLVVGACGPLRCQAQYDFLDVQVGPDGRAWAVMADGCQGPAKCSATGQGIVATLENAPSLRTE